MQNIVDAENREWIAQIDCGAGISRNRWTNDEVGAVHVGLGAASICSNESSGVERHCGSGGSFNAVGAATEADEIHNCGTWGWAGGVKSRCVIDEGDLSTGDGNIGW